MRGTIIANPVMVSDGTNDYLLAIDSAGRVSVNDIYQTVKTQPYQFFVNFESKLAIAVTHNLEAYPFNVKVLINRQLIGGFGLGGFGIGGFGGFGSLAIPNLAETSNYVVQYGNENEFTVFFDQPESGVVACWV